MDDMHLYKLEDEKLKEYELISHRHKDENKTDLGYRILNTRFRNAEQKGLNKSELQKKIEKHQTMKEKLEKAWQDNTGKKVAELQTRANKEVSNKHRAYYRSFSLKEMEVFIKNSERGGNSDEYNDVATDLELYNRVTESSDRNEQLTLLFRIRESCQKYLRGHKHPLTGTGRIRKAIINSINDKVNAQLDESQIDMKTAAQTTYETFKENKIEPGSDANGADQRKEHIESAIKAHFNLIYHVLQGNIPADKSQLAGLDEHMVELMEASRQCSVDYNQNNTVSTRFFNAIGWSANKPKVVTDADLESSGTEFMHSPVKRRMYHTINCIKGEKNAMPLVRQLLGTGHENNRHYLSDGIIGKGTYLAAPTKNEPAQEKKTSRHCWTYGTREGSMQMIMCLNEHARVITESDLLKLVDDKLQATLPKLHRFISDQDRSYRIGRNYLTMFAAMLGYNTIKMNDSQVEGTDYFVTCDRKALSIMGDAEMRKTDGKNEQWDIVEEKKYGTFTNPFTYYE